MNRKADINNQINTKSISKKSTIILIAFLIIYTCIAFKYIHTSYTNFKFQGEYDSYMLPTISIINHGSMIIMEEDILQAATDFPECYYYLKQRFDSQNMAVTKDGRGLNPFYYCTYSVVCIPIKLLLKLLHLPQIYAFPLTNWGLLLFSFLFVYRNLNVNSASKVLCVALLATSPIFNYIIWCSAEVFIFCMLTLSLVYYLNYKYKRAALFLSLAGTLNVTVMFLGFIMIGDFFYHLWKTNDGRFLSKKNLLTTLTFGACFLPVFLPFIHNMIYVSEVNATFHMFQIDGLLGRFSAYLFDLNFGIFLYMPILLLLLLFVLWSAIKNKNGRCIWLAFSMFGVILMYSLAHHINCGMTGASRYGAWTTPFLIILIISFFPYNFVKQWTYVIAFSISVIVTAVLTLTLTQGHMELSNVSRFVLNHAPGLYNPLYSTFNNRVNEIDGGYNYTDALPIIYHEEYGSIRKVLLTKNDGNMLIPQLYGDEQSISYFANQLEQMPSDDKAHYISVPTKYNVYVDEFFGFSDVECILDLDTELTQLDGICIVSENIELQSDTYYKVEVIYSGNYQYSSTLRCDFYGGDTYDSREQENEFDSCQKLANGDYFVDCLLYSGDVSQANQQPQIRILNYSNDISFVKELRVIQLEE